MKPLGFGDGLEKRLLILAPACAMARLKGCGNKPQFAGFTGFSLFPVDVGVDSVLDGGVDFGTMHSLVIFIGCQDGVSSPASQAEAIQCSSSL